MLNQLLNIYELKLLVGLDIVKLGEDRQAVISRLGMPDSSEDRNSYKCDYYDVRNIHIEYHYNTLRCVSIEVFPPAKVMCGGLDLLSPKYDEALRWIKAMDSNVEEDDDCYGDGFTAHTVQIGMGTKLYKEGVIESLIVFSAGYWPSAEEREAAVKEYVDAISNKYKPGEAEALLKARMNRTVEPDVVVSE